MKLLYLGGCSKITVDSDCSHEIKRRLLLGRKVMTNLDSILKSRDITVSTKVHRQQEHLWAHLWLPDSLWGADQRDDRSPIWDTVWRLLLCGWLAGDAQQSWLFLQLDALMHQATPYPRRALGPQPWPSQHSPLNPRSSVWGVLLKLWALSQCWEGGCLRCPSPSLCSLLKAMVFLVVMYGCESWTVKKAERRRIAAFELWCWIRLLRGPWTARKSNQSILKEISPEYSLGRLKLKLQYFGHRCKKLTLGKDPGPGKEWRQEEKGMTEDEMVGWHHWLDEHEFQQALGVGDGQGSLMCCSPWGCKELDMT